MARMLLVASVIILESLVFQVSPVSGQQFATAKFALHVKPPQPPGWSTCPGTNVPDYSPNWEGIPCSEYNLQAPIQSLPMSEIYVVVATGTSEGVTGVKFGISYDPGSLAYWHPCANSLEFRRDGGYGEFPAREGGLVILWQECQAEEIGGQGVHAIVGVLNIYSYSLESFQLRLTQDNIGRTSELGLYSCENEYTVLDSIGRLAAVGFGDSVGYNPCATVDVVAIAHPGMISAYPYYARTTPTPSNDPPRSPSPLMSQERPT